MFFIGFDLKCRHCFRSCKLFCETEETENAKPESVSLNYFDFRQSVKGTGVVNINKYNRDDSQFCSFYSIGKQNGSGTLKFGFFC